MTVRFFTLMGHYASTLDFSNSLRRCGLSAGESHRDLGSTHPWSRREHLRRGGVQHSLPRATNDDFNTPILIATLFDAVKAINGAPQET